MSVKESRTGSSFACNMTRRQYKRIRNIITLTIFLILLIIASICIFRIDNACGLDLPSLPEQAQSLPAPTVKIEQSIPVYDIPLSEDLQKYTYKKCVEYDVDYVMALAIMKEESNYRTDLISDSGDYGIMQINEGNMDYLENSLGTTDFLDPEQNIEAGTFWLSGIYDNYDDPNQILMVYNMGGSIAHALMDEGRESTFYSRGVLRTMDEIREKEKTK